MGVFVNNDTFYAGSTLDPESFIECTEDNMIEAGVRVMIENEQNWNAIMKAVGIEEVRSFAENGGVEVINEGRVGDFLNKVVDFFKKLWQKVVGIFKKMLSLLDQQAQSDSAFVKKYRSEVMKRFANSKIRDGITVKIWKFNNKLIGEGTYNAFDSMYSKSDSEISKCVGSMTVTAEFISKMPDAEREKIMKFTKDNDDISSVIRGWALGESTDYSETEFRKELHERFYGDAKETEDLTQKLVSESFSLIEDTKKAKKDLKDTFDAIDKDLKKVIKAYEALEKSMSKFGDKKGDELKKVTDDYTIITNLTSIVRTGRTTLTTVYTMECQAIKDRNRQARAICGAAYRARDKRDNESSVSEGFEHFSEAGRSVIAGVELV